MSLRLVGYRYSVYSWAVRMALAELGRAVDWVEANPFEAPVAEHPFGRVPVLFDGDFKLYETGAILAYLMRGEHDRKRRARARQVIGIADAYAYKPLVWQIFSHGLFRPLVGAEVDPMALSEGLTKAPAVLAALDEIAAEGLVSDGVTIGAADCHLAPMMGYFAMVPEGAEMLAAAPALARWFRAVSSRDSYLGTLPDLSELEVS